jgi:hypothetical protein
MTTTVLMKMEVFRDVTLCRWIESSRCFERLSTYIFRIKQSKRRWKGLHLCVSILVASEQFGFYVIRCVQTSLNNCSIETPCLPISTLFVGCHLTGFDKICYWKCKHFQFCGQIKSNCSPCRCSVDLASCEARAYAVCGAWFYYRMFLSVAVDLYLRWMKWGADI